MYFDTHAHYDDPRFDNDRGELLGRLLPEGNVSLVMNCGCSRASSLASLALAQAYDYVYAAVGSHPDDCRNMTAADLDCYAALAGNARVRAIGEIGLDYHYDEPREAQLRCFEQQLALAAELGLPVIVHEREAHGDAMALVRKFAGRVRGVFHCYSGSLEQAKELVQLGWYLGFGGAVTFKNARRAPEVLQWLPLERLLLETDCPYMAPEPHRGHRNDSRWLPLVAQRIAQLRALEPERVAEATKINGKILFSIE